MKASSFIAIALLFTASLYCSQTYGQSVGTAADKEKQANLEKNKAHQAEMKKKYNSLPPDQKVEAERKAKEYKKGGYKQQSGTKSTSTSASKPKPKATSSSTAKTTQPAPAGTKPVVKGQPVTTGTKASPQTPAASTGKADVGPQKSAAPAKTTVVPNATPVPQKTSAEKATTTIKTTAAEPVKK